jgi:predicted phosphate transport protein (TIGR00153 family)
MIDFNPDFLYANRRYEELSTMKLFPKTVDFFDTFELIATNISNAAEQFVELLENMQEINKQAKIIHEMEQDGDMFTHDVMKKLHKTFITPIDREDLYALASRLDDILDSLWAAADRMTVFKLKESTKLAITMAKDLHVTAELVHRAIKKLKAKNYSHVQEFCIEINKFENKIDRDFRDALAELFDEIKDPILIIKWKEIYEHLEAASDKCEDVANILEAIVLKHA